VNLAVAAAVFPVIFLGELPDKTMFASLVMATRGRPFAVWLGATAAFAVHASRGPVSRSTTGCEAEMTRIGPIPRRRRCGGGAARSPCSR
jgi:hypothetical protein